MSQMFSEYPSEYRLVGSEPDASLIKIFVDSDVLKQIKIFLSSDTKIELGGVLVGEILRNTDNYEFAKIQGFIPAENTDSTLVSLTFTHSTWEKINTKLDSEYKGKSIIGWFHSHPGHTVFLSGYDEFIHRNFFNDKNGIAYVFDPVLNQEGFFANSESGPKKLDGFYIFDKFSLHSFDFSDDNSNIHQTEKENDTDDNKGRVFFPKIYTILLIIVCSFTGLYSIIKMHSLNDELEALSSTNSVILKKMDSLSVELSNKKSDAFYPSGFFRYVIKEGENLKKIALMFYNDTNKVSIIVKSNFLRDEFDVKSGQIIKIPILPE